MSEDPRRLVLGADSWQVLVTALGALVLPAPLRAADGPELDEAQRAAAVLALQEAGVLLGPGVPADLHPSVVASLAVHLRPEVSVDTRVQRGPVRTTAHHVAAGPLGSGLVRQTQEREGGRWTGPVELSTFLLGDLTAEVVAVLGEVPGVGDRTLVQLDAAASLAAVRLLRDGREDAAAALPGDSTHPALAAIADGLEAVAVVTVTGRGGVRAMVLLETGDGWWEVHSAGEDVVLTPVDLDELVTRLATGLTASLVGGAA